MKETLPNSDSLPPPANLLAAGLDRLEATLPPGWSLERQEELGSSSVGRADAVVGLKALNQKTPSIVVEAHTSFAPRDVAKVLGGRRDVLRQVAGPMPVLVIAPALSERSRYLLSEKGYGYADLAGNVRLALETPGLFIDRVTSNPLRKTRQSHASLRGNKAGRIVRVLADVAPPYGVLELARAADVTPGYVSKLLDYLDSEAMIDRGRRGVVTDVAWQELLRGRAQHYNVFAANRAQFFIARSGPALAHEQLHNDHGVCLTGSFLAAQVAPIATPTLLALYVRVRERAADMVRKLDLLPTDQGANVVLLQPYDSFVLQRLRYSTPDAYLRRSIPAVSCAQAALDCLTGNGRMPAEGDALIDWMASNKSRWRVDSIDEVGPWERTP